MPLVSSSRPSGAKREARDGVRSTRYARGTAGEGASLDHIRDDSGGRSVDAAGSEKPVDELGSLGALLVRTSNDSGDALGRVLDARRDLEKVPGEKVSEVAGSSLRVPEFVGNDRQAGTACDGCLEESGAVEADGTAPMCELVEIPLP